MEAEVQGYLTEFGILRGQIADATKGLNDEVANWRPLAEGTNSIYAILTHLTGAEIYWIRQVIGGEPYQRDREAEFHASGHIAEVLSRWEKVSVETETALGRLSLPQLRETRNVPSRPDWGAITVQWAILHLISHRAVHLGHIQLTSQMREQRPS